jgi:hypothetical protein
MSADGDGPPKGDGHWHWRYLFRSPRHREGTQPAAMVIVVVVVGLLAAALLNADATLRKSKANGDGLRQEVAGAVAGVSDAFGLSAGRNRLDQALGRDTGPAIDVEQLLAQEQEKAAAQAGTEEQQEAASQVPVLRTPTLDNPLKLWVGGDSVGGSFGVQMQPVAASTGLFTPTLDFTVGTGLARPEYYNWPEHFAKDVIPSIDPDIVIPMFGANDDQNMELADGTLLKKYSPEWFIEYRRRVGATMDLLKSPDNDRLVLWVGSVPAGPGSQISNQDTLNYIYWSEAQKRPWVSYLDTWAILGDPDHGYVETVVNADGKARDMFQKDNLHLATTGALRLSWAAIYHLGRMMDLSATKIPVPPPSEAPPADLQERTELPKPANAP